MAQYTQLTDYNMSKGADQLLLYASDNVPILMPLILFAVFIVITMGTFFSERRLTGRGRFPASFAVGAYITTLVALVMSMIEGLVSVYTVSVCVTLSIIGTLWLWVSKE